MHGGCSNKLRNIGRVLKITIESGKVQEDARTDGEYDGCSKADRERVAAGASNAVKQLTLHLPASAI